MYLKRQRSKMYKTYLMAVRYGNNVSIMMTKTTGVIVGEMSFRNPYEGHTLQPAIDQAERLLGKNSIKTITVDRAYRGVSKINEVIIQSPKPFNKKTQTKYKQKKLKKQFGRRAVIKPVVGHLKSDHRMKRNFYSGIIGDAINVMLSAAIYNFKKMIRKWKTSFCLFFYRYYISTASLAVGQIISFFDQIIYPQESWVFKGLLLRATFSINKRFYSRASFFFLQSVSGCFSVKTREMQ